MVEKTIESFIRKLNEEGHHKYASELRYIIAMSRKRKDAITALSVMTITLLIHIIKLVSMPQSRDKNKWRKEIVNYLSTFNIRNKNPKGIPWLSLQYIQDDLNDVLSSPDFIKRIKKELQDYSDFDKNNALYLLKTNKTLKNLKITLFYGPDNDLKININGQIF